MGCSGVSQLLQELVSAYYQKRDVEAALACVTEDIKWVGTEKSDSADGKAALRALLQADVAAFPASFDIALGEPVVQELAPGIVNVWITGHQVEVPGQICGFSIRATLTCVERGGGWLVACIHVSVPNAESEKFTLEQQNMRELMDQVPAGVGIYEVKDGKIRQVYMNNAFYTMLGSDRASRERYFGENTMDAVHPDDAPLLHDAMRELLAGKHSVRVAYRLKMPNERWFWVSLAGSVVERSEGYLKLYAALSDYNGIKRAQQELENARVTLETALNSAKVLTWRYDYRHSRITDSLTLGEWFHLPKVVENVPQSIIDAGFIAPESQADFRRLFERVATEQPATVDTKANVVGESGYVWYKQIYTPVYDSMGHYQDCIAVAIDITEQKNREHQYEEQLRLNQMAAQDSLAVVSYNLSQNSVTESHSAEPEIRRDIAGATADEVLGAIHDRIIEADDPALLQSLRSAASLMALYQKGVAHVELRHRLKNDHHWLCTTVDMISNPYTDEIEAIGFLRDITDSVRAELVVNQLLKVDYQSILLIDLKTGTVSPIRQDRHDENLESITALQREQGDMSGGLDEFLRRYALPGTAERAILENSTEYVQKQLEKAPYYETLYTLVQNGQKRQYRTMYTYLSSDHTELLSAVQDTTAMYEQEEKQKAELSAALAEAEQANRTKTDFMSRMSHDMRTPMNAILGLCALTLDDAKNPAAVRENMGKMHQAGDFMLGLVNDILDMARIEDGSVTLNMEPYTYSDFLLNMKTMFVPQCQAKGIAIEFVEPQHIDPTGLTDKIRINQIFFNIFSNAVKYTPTGGSIRCRVENIRVENGVVSGDYVITDTGIGMSREFQERLFEPFMQEDGAVTPELQGSGLGLSITKQLVELMGGRIRVESQKGKGTTVTVSLSFRLVPKPAEPARRAGADQVSLAGRHVLLVEDHPLNAQIARRLLEKRDMVVTYAENGRAAVQKFGVAEPGAFDVILMDIRMPELNGFEATRAIRALQRADAAKIPIIAMSANAYPEDIQKGLGAGMNDYLTKPVEPEKLYAVIAKNL